MTVCRGSGMAAPSVTLRSAHFSDEGSPLLGHSRDFYCHSLDSSCHFYDFLDIPAIAGIQRVLKVCLEIRNGSPINTFGDDNCVDFEDDSLKTFEDDKRQMRRFLRTCALRPHFGMTGARDGCPLPSP